MLIEALREEVGKDLDAFDLICHVAFDMPPLTRKERAENVKKRNYFAKYGDQARKIIDGLLDKYVQDGVVSIEDTTRHFVRCANATELMLCTRSSSLQKA